MGKSETYLYSDHGCQHEYESMSLSSEHPNLYHQQKSIEDEECQVNLQYVMHLIWKLMLKRVHVFSVRVAVDQPYVIFEL